MENVKAIVINTMTDEIDYYDCDEYEFYSSCIPKICTNVYKKIKNIDEISKILVLYKNCNQFMQYYAFENDFKNWFFENHFNKVKESKPKAQKYKPATAMTL